MGDPHILFCVKNGCEMGIAVIGEIRKPLVHKDFSNCHKIFCLETYRMISSIGREKAKAAPIGAAFAFSAVD